MKKIRNNVAAICVATRIKTRRLGIGCLLISIKPARQAQGVFQEPLHSQQQSKQLVTILQCKTYDTNVLHARGVYK